MKYLDENGLLYFWQKIVNKFVQKDGNKVLSTNDFTDAYKTKLDGIAAEATKTVIDTSLNSTSTNPVQNKVINTALGNKVDKVSGKGLSTNDYTTDEKNKLAGIAAGANKTTVDSALSSTSTNPVQNKAINTALGNKVDKVDGKGLSSNDFTDALLTKLNGIDTGANKITVDSSLSSTSSNPVQNKAIYTALDEKVDAEDGKGLSTNDFTTALKTKLEGIEEGATAITVDDTMSSSSTNPVQNKVINTALGKKANLSSPTLTGTPKAPTATAGTNTTQIATTAFVQTAIESAIGSVTQISYEVVASLPATGVTGKIYLVSHAHGTSDAYDEYIWVESSSSFEKIGNTDIDLSGYVLTTDLVAITNAEIDTIVAA